MHILCKLLKGFYVEAVYKENTGGVQWMCDCWYAGPLDPEEGRTRTERGVLIYAPPTNAGARNGTPTGNGHRLDINDNSNNALLISEFI